MNELADEIEKEGGPRPIAISSDLYEDNASINLAKSALDAVGHIDILINNAGGSRPFADLHVDEERWEEAFTLNFHRPRQLADALIDQMIDREYGRIINITGKSEPDHVSEQIYRNYTPEYRQWQCDNEIPMARYGEPEDLAALATFLSSPIASYITGTVIPVDGGLRRYQF